MTKLPRRATAWLAFVCVCAAPTFAFAQAGSTAAPKASGYAETRSDGGSNVVFDDDKALGTAYDPFSDIIKAPPRAGRMALLRPRYNFVPELLKSVENL